MVKGRDGPALFEPGTCIGRYRIENELGRGGTSVVYLATDLHLGKQWAVKVIRCEESGNGEDDPKPKAVTGPASLLDEAELMKRLDHPALPRIIDIMEKDGMLVLVMDYVKGENLAALLKRAGPFSEEIVREWMYRLAAVLEYLHRQDPPIIYRDMKPANVIRKPDGSLILLDLGIAREYKHDREQDTEALGTKGYAPPEQYGSAQTDIRSDIYSLGMTAAELLTGCPPDQDPYLYKTHPFRKLLPGISKEFDTILNRCLAFSPQDRYGSCRELMQDLRRKTVYKRKTVHRKKLTAGGETGRRKERRCAGNRKGSLYAVSRKRKHYGRSRGQSSKGIRNIPAPDRKKIRAAVLAGLIVLESAAAVLIREPEQPDVRAETVRAESVPEQNSLQEIRGLLDACGREGALSEDNSAVLQQKLAGLPPDATRNKAVWAELCFTIGRAYLYTYSGDSGSFRGRVLRAKPFFEEALKCLEEKSSFEEEPAGGEELSEKKVRNYVRLCDFFARYIYDRDGISEPEAGDCERILEAVTLCLEETETQETGDGMWLQLTLLQSMENLLGEYRQYFADAGIPQESVLQILQNIEEKTSGMPVKRETLVKLREEILQDCAECRKQIVRTYASIEKWKEAEKVYGSAAEQQLS